MIESSYSKLFSSIVSSTIWQEDDATRIVWITLLALKNRNGEVATSIPGLAHHAKVSLAACERAIKKMMSPDKFSRTKDHDGRRIAEIDGGFRILNHFKYREAMSEAERRASQAEWQRQYRLRKKRNQTGSVDGSVEVVTSTLTHTDTDSKKERKPKRPRSDYQTHLACTDPEKYDPKLREFVEHGTNGMEDIGFH